jgi:hypothetical protein
MTVIAFPVAPPAAGGVSWKIPPVASADQIPMTAHASVPALILLIMIIRPVLAAAGSVNVTSAPEALHRTT